MDLGPSQCCVHLTGLLWPQCGLSYRTGRQEGRYKKICDIKTVIVSGAELDRKVSFYYRPVTGKEPEGLFQSRDRLGA